MFGHVVVLVELGAGHSSDWEGMVLGSALEVCWLWCLLDCVMVQFVIFDSLVVRGMDEAASLVELEFGGAHWILVVVADETVWGK